MWAKLFGIGALDGPAFTRYVAKLGVQSGRFENPDVDPDAMRIRQGSEVIDLGNRHHMFLQLPRRQRLQFIHDVILVAPPSVPETWDAAKPHLIPVVRDAGYLTIAPLHARLALKAPPADDDGTTIARRPLATDIFETLVVDTPVQMMVVNRGQLADWGVDFEQAIDVAYTNLRKQSQDAFEQLAPGVWAAPWTDSYAAARTVLPDVLQRVCSDPLVALPSRDRLFVADASSPLAFEILIAAIKRSQASDRYPITPRIYQLEGKKLRDYTPPATLPAELRHEYKLLLVENAVTLYKQEKEMRQRGDDGLFFASLLAYERDGGEVITRATWTKGVPTHLPPADAVVFVDLDDGETEPRGIYEVPWDVVAAEPGMLTKTDSPLPRWKTGEFPSAEWLGNYKQEQAQ